jgi:hypothetical protein
VDQSIDAFLIGIIAMEIDVTQHLMTHSGVITNKMHRLAIESPIQFVSMAHV